MVEFKGFSSVTFGATGMKQAPAGAVTLGVCDEDVASTVKGKAMTISATGSTGYESYSAAGC